MLGGKGFIEIIFKYSFLVHSPLLKMNTYIVKTVIGRTRSLLWTPEVIKVFSFSSFSLVTQSDRSLTALKKCGGS